MQDILLILHLLGLGAGMTAMFAAPVLQWGMRAFPAEAPAFAKLQPRFSRVGQIGLGVLWITGPWMLFMTYGGGSGLGWTFWAKFVCVVAVTAGVILLDMGGRQARAGDAAARARLPIIGAATGVLLLLVVVFAVLTFH